MGTDTNTGGPSACLNSDFVTVPRSALRALVDHALPGYARARYSEGASETEDSIEWGTDHLKSIVDARLALIEQTFSLALIRAQFMCPDDDSGYPPLEAFVEELARLEDTGRV
jgi:hypothetical protein